MKQRVLGVELARHCVGMCPKGLHGISSEPVHTAPAAPVRGPPRGAPAPVRHPPQRPYPSYALHYFVNMILNTSLSRSLKMTHPFVRYVRQEIFLLLNAHRRKSMPSMNILIDTGVRTQRVLRFASVPGSLVEEIIANHAGIDAVGRGLPSVQWAEPELTLTFPKLAESLQDWIRYEVSRDGTMTGVGGEPEEGRQYPSGRSAETERAQAFTNGSIVLLLESPHIHEMKAGQPAAGPTGRNIEGLRNRLTRLFQTLIGQLRSSTTWEKLPLVIANPCPYPTSCLANVDSWALFRDFVFSRMFPLVARDFTQRRLTKYRPLIVLNACTGGNEAGRIIGSNLNGDLVITEGEKPASPKELVNDQIRTWLGARCFERQYRKNSRKQQAFVLDEKKQVEPCPGRTLKGYWIDVGHPISWKDRDTPVTTDGSSRVSEDSSE